MVTSEERLRILRMIEEGKISAEEGSKLLAALNESRKETRPTSPAAAGRINRGWLRVRVSDVATGKTRVSVNLPLSLMEAGMKIGSQFAPELGGMDLNQLLEEVKNGAQGKIVDVVDEEDGEHVEVFVE